MSSCETFSASAAVFWLSKPNCWTRRYTDAESNMTSKAISYGLALLDRRTLARWPSFVGETWLLGRDGLGLKEALGLFCWLGTPLFKA